MSTNLAILIAIISISSVFAFPASDSSLVVSSTEASINKEDVSKNSTEPPVLPKIYDMKINTNVTNRYAKTQVTSKVKNLDKKAQEATFSVVLPDHAFISGFIMEIDGKSYEAYVQEKEEAKKTYDQAVQSGFGAAHVAVSARDSNRFTVSVNIEPQSKATFYLTYEELLQRQKEQYEIILNIHPGQPVSKLNVEVLINETRPLKFVKAPSLRSGNEISKNDDKLDPQAQIDLLGTTAATVKFSPDIERQKQLAQELGTKEENGLAGQFVVQYDVERDPQGGEILINDGYFVHFFAPTEVPALPKQVVFVLDTSSSMYGIRITQLKEAMNSILSDLKPEDSFNIVEFGSLIKVWDVQNVRVAYETGSLSPWSTPVESTTKKEQTLPPAYPANEENIKKAKEVVHKLEANGGTDIEGGLKTALELVDLNKQSNSTLQPIIVFLTDGEPTVGESNPDKIKAKITDLNAGKSPIFSLSFGDFADRAFLEKISLSNLGFARHIYEGADASLQLEEFYKQISSPLLSNIKFKYVSNSTSDVTKTHFPILFRGGELVVTGRIIDPGFVAPPVEGLGLRGPIDFIPNLELPRQKSVGSLEKIWAFLTLKQILEQRDLAEDKTGPTQEALKLALQYKFVTDVSSLVVVKPNASAPIETQDASNNQAFDLPIYNKLGFVSGGAISLSASGFAPNVGAGFSHNYFAQPEAAQVDADYASTPVVFALPPAPIPPSTTPQSPLAKLQQSLPWLKEVLSANGTISLESGSFDLGVAASSVSAAKCPKTPAGNSTEGVCRLLEACPHVFGLLTSFDTYKSFSCVVDDKYAGVCCPIIAQGI